MGKKYEISTLIKRKHELGENTYVRGRVSGIQSVICEEDKTFANCEIDEGFVLTTKCTPEQYDDFMDCVEEYYPGLCEFDYEFKRP